ncbi:hypothetical protein [Paenibacillus glucanolyticus]|uniref:hypothetical protein n=1 Tax=Paenibacillus glucanolyticus TaxID=59843 RepID=UPI000A746709|nr:hypothetical protein [Paenibacillus glucanolyticus]
MSGMNGAQQQQLAVQLCNLGGNTVINRPYVYNRQGAIFCFFQRGWTFRNKDINELKGC